MNKVALVVGTRGSDLALAQAKLIIDMLYAASGDDHPINLSEKVIRTSGDEYSSELNSANSTGKDSFTRELDKALLSGEIDFAVHSLKDVPSDSTINGNIEISSFPVRDSAFDVLISGQGGRTLATMPHHAKIGTSSIRRRVQLKNFRPDFEVREIHGNVPTRIKKLRSGESGLDGIILAEAGLKRLGMELEIDEVISKDIILPAVGQGCLAISTRSNDEVTKWIVRQIDDADTRVCVMAERNFSKELGGGCNQPVAALATINQGTLTIEGLIAPYLYEPKSQGPPNVNGVIRAKLSGPREEGENLGIRLALDLKRKIAGS